jgi:hypothetical protein
MLTITVLFFLLLLFQAWEDSCGPLGEYGMRYMRMLANFCNGGLQPQHLTQTLNSGPCRRPGAQSDPVVTVHVDSDHDDSLAPAPADYESRNQQQQQQENEEEEREEQVEVEQELSIQSEQLQEELEDQLEGEAVWYDEDFESQSAEGAGEKGDVVGDGGDMSEGWEGYLEEEDVGEGGYDAATGHEEEHDEERLPLTT